MNNNISALVDKVAVLSSGVVGVKLLGGGAALLMAPPASHTFFASWSGTGVMSQAQHGMTVGYFISQA